MKKLLRIELIIHRIVNTYYYEPSLNKYIRIKD